jgi:hypothetical protein
MNIPSILRHWFTLLATLLTGWLVLPAEQQAELTKALGDLVGPLAIILTLVVTATWRMALTWLSKIFRAGSGELENRGPSGGMGLLLMITAVALGGALPSCSPAEVEALRGIPIKGCIQTDDGTVCYSSKGGISYEIDRRSNK